MKILERIPIRIRISFGLVGLMTGSLLVASAAGFFPNEQEEILRGRVKLCEALAISGTAMASTGQADSLKVTLESIVHRDPEVRSIGLRSVEGVMLVTAGPHTSVWVDDLQNINQMRVPVFRFGKQYGEMQVAFAETGGWMGLNYWSPAWLLIVLIPACLVQFSIFLRRTLENLDPNGAVPKEVEKALDTFNVGLLLLNSRSRIIFANRRFAAMLGCTPEELTGKPINELAWIYPADKETSSPWDDAKSNDKNVHDRILQYDVDGRRLTFTANCTPITGQGILATFDDITLIEENKIALAAARDEAQSANEAKSTFLANMSHEIRTPLNAVLGFTDVLRRGMVTNSDEAVDHLNMIHQSGAHLLELINDILDLSKIEAGRLQVESIDTHPDQLMLTVANVLRSKADEKEICIVTSLRNSIPRTIKCDPTRLRQIITNLVGNAIKFTEKGDVQIVAELIEKEEEKHSLRIDVIDTGIGMSAEAQGKIFQDFVQADSSTTRKFGGTGLGLSISRRLAEAMGGELSVTSKLGEGSTFTLTLPVERESLSESVSPEEMRELSLNRMATMFAGDLVRLPKLPVLIVDDGEANRRLIELVLRRAGAVPTCAENGREAVDLVHQNEYSLILMDMQMPILDGYAATKLLREQGSTIPIIALTGNAMKGDREKCLSAGCDAFLAKPVNIDELLILVRSFLGDCEIETQILSEVSELDTMVRSSQVVAPDGDTPIHSTLPTDDREFCEIIIDFIARLDIRLEAMRTELQCGNFEHIASEAHWLKGAGGTVGFDAFTKPSAELVEAARRCLQTECEKSLAEIESVRQRIVTPSIGAGVPPSGGDRAIRRN